MHVHLNFLCQKEMETPWQEHLRIRSLFRGFYSLLFLHLLHVSLFVLWENEDVCLQTPKELGSVG